MGVSAFAELARRTALAAGMVPESYDFAGFARKCYDSGLVDATTVGKFGLCVNADKALVLTPLDSGTLVEKFLFGPDPMAPGGVKAPSTPAPEKQAKTPAAKQDEPASKAAHPGSSKCECENGTAGKVSPALGGPVSSPPVQQPRKRHLCWESSEDRVALGTRVKVTPRVAAVLPVTVAGPGVKDRVSSVFSSLRGTAGAVASHVAAKVGGYSRVGEPETEMQDMAEIGKSLVTTGKSGDQPSAPPQPLEVPAGDSAPSSSSGVTASDDGDEDVPLDRYKLGRDVKPPIGEDGKPLPPPPREKPAAAPSKPVPPRPGKTCMLRPTPVKPEVVVEVYEGMRITAEQAQEVLGVENEYHTEDLVEITQTQIDPRSVTFHQVKRDPTSVRLASLAIVPSVMGHATLWWFIRYLLYAVSFFTRLVDFFWVLTVLSRRCPGSARRVAGRCGTSTNLFYRSVVWPSVEGWLTALAMRAKQIHVDLSLVLLYGLFGYAGHFLFYSALVCLKVARDNPGAVSQLFYCLYFVWAMVHWFSDFLPGVVRIAASKCPPWVPRCLLAALSFAMFLWHAGSLFYSGQTLWGWHFAWLIYLVLRRCRRRLRRGQAASRVYVYCPALLSSVLAECSYDAEEVKNRGVLALRRAATPLRIGADKVHEILSSTYELAQLVVDNREVFRFRTRGGGDVFGDGGQS